jgi:hypothetical protein
MTYRSRRFLRTLLIIDAQCWPWLALESRRPGTGTMLDNPSATIQYVYSFYMRLVTSRKTTQPIIVREFWHRRAIFCMVVHIPYG